MNVYDQPAVCHASERDKPQVNRRFSAYGSDPSRKPTEVDGSAPAKDQPSGTPKTSRSLEVKRDAGVSHNPATAPPNPIAANTPSGAQVQSSGLGLTGSGRERTIRRRVRGRNGSCSPSRVARRQRGWPNGSEVHGGRAAVRLRVREARPKRLLHLLGARRAGAGARVGGLPWVSGTGGDVVTRRARAASICPACSEPSGLMTCAPGRTVACSGQSQQQSVVFKLSTPSAK